MQLFWKKILLLPVIVLLAAAWVSQPMLGAQELSSVKGGLGGIVTDSSGAVVPGAKVTITGAADTRDLVTDENGRYSTTGLTPGLYKVKVEKEGFSASEAKNVEVVINRISTLDLKLTTGAVSETIEVSSNAVQIDTSSTAVGTDLTSTFYSQVPVQRNVGSLFYVAPGVVNGGGTGNANPSIGGATGLENSYVADGVSINDAGYGGLGVYSPSYGSLGTGINLSFIQEVQVKTGAFEPKYGGVNGGVVQIVTKSGGSQYHGAVSAYFAPEGMSAAYKSQDVQRAFAGPGFQRGYLFSQPAYDGSVELGGYIPIQRLKDKLFFFGAFNPSLNQVNYLAPNTAFSAALFAHGPYTTSITTYNWAGKLTYNVLPGTSLEASAYGDPSQSNFAYNAAFSNTNAYPNLNQRNNTSFSRWDFGTRSIVARLNSSLSPTALLSIAATAKTSHFTESGFANDYSISDRTNGIQQFQGLGSFQNPENHSYGVSFDFQKIVPFHGEHSLSVGWAFSHNIYDATRDYSGPRFPFPATNIEGTPTPDNGGSSALVGAMTSAAFYLYPAPAGCSLQYCPNYVTSNGNTEQVYLRQVRGIWSSPDVSSSEGYHAIYGNDSWAINRYITIDAGIRWEEEQLNGPNQQYVFNDNWSPRLGINIDPFGNGKSKVFFNWGRYTQALPTDAAIRELNQELDLTSARWAAPSDGAGNLIINPDGTVTATLDAAHLLSGAASQGFGSSPVVASSVVPELIHSGTKLNFEEEYVIGLEHQLSQGFVISARYSDRRLLRIVEDMQGVSPEGANAGLPNQIYLIGNPNPSADYFVNEQEEKYTGALPANCVLDYGPQSDSLGHDLGSACGLNPDTAGFPTPDGKPDGFATPVRHYQALEIEVNKNFSHNYLIRANYRFAKLWGNYEGLFRNDNGQSDPGISSLFDFTTGVLGLLGDQFTPGYLNTDRRNVGNVYGAYTVPGSFGHGLTVGLGLRGSSGTPLNRLLSHPVYQTVGEIPYLGRGTAGRTASTLQLDLHSDYPISLGDKFKLKLAFDAFNVTNSQFVTTKNQDLDTGFQAPLDPTYGSPTSFQRAFYGRGSVRLEF